MKSKTEMRDEANTYIDFVNSFRCSINKGEFEFALDLLELHPEFYFPSDPYIKSIDDLAKLALNSAIDSAAYGYALNIVEKYFPDNQHTLFSLAKNHSLGLLRLYEASGNPFLKQSSDVDIQDVCAYSKEIKNDIVDVWNKYFRNEDFIFKGEKINLPFEISIVDMEHKLSAWYFEYSQAKATKRFLIETEWLEKIADVDNHINYLLEKPLGIDLYSSFN